MRNLLAFLLLLLFSLFMIKLYSKSLTHSSIAVYYHGPIDNSTTTKQSNATCHVESWNRVDTETFPFREEYKSWAMIRMTALEGMYDRELRLISALQYLDYCVVTTAHQDPRYIGTTMYCRYFDCKRQEIPNSTYESFFFPMTVVHCPRRAGAKFMALSFNATDNIGDMIPLKHRVFEEVPYEIGVCVGHIYGEERKWLQIIEFVEHHRLLGVEMFYFTILEMDGYSKKVIEEYVRTGLADVSFVNTEYSTINILFHQMQLHDCFFRSKFHSKWVINVDIDERLVTNHQHPLPTFLQRQDPRVCEMIFSTRRIPKMEMAPRKYAKSVRLEEQLEFLKYEQLLEYSWEAAKIVFRPDKVHSIFMHWSWTQHPDCRLLSVPNHIAYVRHYRLLNRKGLGANWLNDQNLQNVPLDPKFSNKLSRAVKAKVKYLYDLKPIPCERIEQFFRDLYKNDTLKCV